MPEAVPELLLKDNLLLPIIGARESFDEIKEQVSQNSNIIILNGLFIMGVALFESMIRKQIAYCLAFSPNRLPEREIAFPKTALIENEHFNIMENLISDYIDRKSIKELENLYFKVLNIRKPTKQIVDEIVRIKNIRNDLVHKSLNVNYKYRRTHFPTDSNKSRDYQTQVHQFLDTYYAFLDHITLEINEKFKAYTKINLLEKLWHYTFHTPLCGNFNDYWVIDKDNDCIEALKHPKQESGLSHSEKFLLGIWRSQLTTSNVEFINMSSLDNHAQSCLYIFLKLSNNLFMYY
jgi:hypothetical protein